MRTGRPRALLVEDSKPYARLAGIALEDVCDVEVAATLAEAREVAATGDFDIILTDLHLPDGELGTVVRTLHSAAPRTEILAISGSADLPASDVVLAGASGVLHKGTELDGGLAAAVRAVLERHADAGTHAPAGPPANRAPDGDAEETPAAVPTPSRLADLVARYAGGRRILGWLLPYALAAPPIVAFVVVALRGSQVTGGHTATVLATLAVMACLGAVIGAAARSLLAEQRSRRAAEAAARRGEAEWRTLTATAPIGIFRTDATGSSTWMNAHFLALTGLAEEDALGTGWSAAVHPADRRRTVDAWGASAATGRRFELDVRFRRPDGAVASTRVLAEPVREDGVVVGWTGVIVDLTPQRDAERELRLGRNRLQAVLDNAPAGISLKDVEGRVVVANERFTDLHAGTVPARRAAMTLEDAEVIRTRRTSAADELVSRPGEPARIVHIIRFPVLDEDGFLIGVGAVETDVTERRQMEEELARRSEQLARAQALAHVGSFQWDLGTGVFETSDELLRIFGRRRTEDGLDFDGLVVAATHEEDRAALHAATGSALAERRPMDLTLRVARGDGGQRWVRLQAETRTEGERAVLTGTMQDITEAHVREGELRAARDRFERLVRQAPIGLGLLDREGRWVQVNPALCALLGRSADALLGHRLADVIDPRDRAADDELRAALLAGELPAYEVEQRIIGHDEMLLDVLVSVSAVPEATGDVPERLVVQLLDVSERRRLEERLRHLAATDPLTGLPNRRLFDASLRSALARARRDGRIPGLLVVDLDAFKSINDRHGHAAGDAVLHATANALRDGVRGGDLVARIGGDEFAVLLDAVDGDHLAVIAEKLRSAVAAAVPEHAGHEVTVSVGGAVGSDGATGDDLFERADRALYAAKRAGRDRVVVDA